MEQGTLIVECAQFEELFNAKYFLLCKKMEKGWEFMNFKQTRNMTVAQYEDSFTRLIKYMPIYQLDEEAKAEKFLGGLKLEIQQTLRSLGACTYTKVVLWWLAPTYGLHRWIIDQITHTFSY